ncbi:proto-oncogene DBL-like [Corythoichthys intestinalis]|uniref:proto-oncogene DBL-like n=1 Tax=Corythoichthys intestinalis TaxID=161448 RepID=UPI0025A5523B|nr:proto-oncogene DBL-like [Corythoichthys intestinalis]
MAESKPAWGFPRLRRAATSFPGNLHLVLVLHPSTLQSSAPSPSSSTDLGFRFSHDDFLFKMPVVMLRSVGDLLRYIDESRLTSDIRGTAADQSRGDWIVLRSAIETFAVTVKEAAHLLQGFGSELSDSELPDKADAVDFLLRSHTQRYRHMKEDIVGVLKEGRHLLDNLETLQASKKDNEEDVRSDLATVQRLLAQLRDMEEAFDGFFEKHHLKMQQYHQLLLYESNFQQMEEELEKMAAEEKAIPAVGSTLMQTEQLIKDLHTLEQRAEEVMSRAQVLMLQGHQLAACHHYALALIMQRCNELRHHCDVISGGLRAKHATLARARDLLFRLDRALRWCDEGAYLLASQMVDRFQSREGAQEALQYLSCHQERAPDMLDNKQDVLSLEFEAILTPQLQGQIAMVTEKLASMRAMIRNREQCLRKMVDVRVRPIQPVAPRPEAEPAETAEATTQHGAKTPLFSPKHGVDFNLLNSRFSFDLLPGKRTSRRTGSQRKIEVMHDYQGNRSSLYGSAPESDSEVEEGAEQVTSRIMKELLSTEKIYVEQLLAVLLGYRAEMEDPSASDLLPPLLQSHKDVLFGNMPQIYQFHSRTFLRDLQSCLDAPERVGQCFLQRKEKFQMYEQYCQNKPRSESLWRQCSDSAFFQECQRKLEHKLSLDSYLLKPIQRLTKYQLILKELLKHCTEPHYRTQLQEALDCMLDLLKSVNDSMHQTAIVGYQGELGLLGRVLLQGSFSVWISHKRGAARMRELARFKPAQRHVFLYERALVCCKRRNDHRRLPVYSFKSCLRMNSVSLTENVKGDAKKFELYHKGTQEVYILQATSMQVKVTWLTEIQKIITQLHQESLILDSASEASERREGCTGCLPVTRSSSASSAAHHTRWEESFNTSPAHSDPAVHSVATCDSLEDWAATDGSDMSDSDDDEEEDEPAPLVAGRYRVQVASSVASADDIIFTCGDIIRLLRRDEDGIWLVRNVSRDEEGRVPSEDLHRILGETC